MPEGARRKLGVGGVLILAAMAVFALFLALVVVPWIAESSGANETKVTIIFSLALFAVAIGATLWAKALNKKAAEGK